MARDLALTAFLVATGVSWLFVFFGGTARILLSRQAPWKTRLRWAALSLAAPTFTLVVAAIFVLLRKGFGVEAVGGPVSGFVGITAFLAAPIGNWITYKKFQASVSPTSIAAAPAINTSAMRAAGKRTITLGCIVVAVGLYLTTKSVAFAVEMFYGGPWVDPYYAHFMGVTMVLISALVLWAGLRHFRKGLAAGVGPDPLVLPRSARRQIEYHPVRK